MMARDPQTVAALDPSPPTWRDRLAERPAVAGLVQTLTVAGTAIAGIAVLGLITERIMLDDLRHELGQTARTAAAMVDGDQHRKFVAQGHAEAAEYETAVRPLKLLLRTNPDIRFTYTAILRGDTMHYVLDADPSDDSAIILEADPDPPLPGEREVWRTGQLVVEKAPSSTAWGSGIRAYAPVLDRDGRQVAYLGVTMNAERYAQAQRQIGSAILLGVGVSVLLSLISGCVIWHLQRQRNRAMAEALAASRAKSQFLANMSHEIRTPMNAVIGLIDMMLRSGLPAELQRFASTAQTSARALLDIINDILDISKIEAGRLELEHVDFDISKCVEDACQTMAVRAQAKDIGLHWSVDPALQRMVAGDAGRLRQVLLNLIGNAVKFTDEGGVTVHAAHVSEDERAVHLRVEVKDTGIGVGPNTRRLLFTPFTQADGSITRRYGGTGLGLSIARELVTLMGGVIGVDSESGVGSTFWFTAGFDQPGATPVSLAVPAETGTQPIPATAAPTAVAGRILVVEDNPVNQQVVGAMLDHLGIEYLAASDGSAALELATDTQFDLILMDCQMPVLDGYGTTELLRARCTTDRQGRPVPIVALTANAFEEDRQRCAAAGMDGFLTKPITVAALEQELSRWLGVPRASAGITRAA